MTFGQLFFALSIGRYEHSQTRTLFLGHKFFLFCYLECPFKILYHVLICILSICPFKIRNARFKWLVGNSRRCSIFVIHFWFLEIFVQSIYARFIYDGFIYGFRWFPGCGNLFLVLQSRKLAKRGKFYMLCYICKFASFMISFIWFAWYMVIDLW